MKSQDVIKSLRKRHGTTGAAAEWAFFEELRLGTGYQSTKEKAIGINPEQRLDAWAINLYPSNKFLKVTYEVKVSRSDFLHEIKHPEKRQQGLWVSNEFYFVTPAGLVERKEVPTECGLIYVYDNDRSRLIVRAPLRKTDDYATWRFFASIARRTATAEQEIVNLKVSQNYNKDVSNANYHKSPS